MHKGEEKKRELAYLLAPEYILFIISKCELKLLDLNYNLPKDLTAKK